MSATLFHDFWWLLFPVLGLAIAALDLARDHARDRAPFYRVRQQGGRRA